MPEQEFEGLRIEKGSRDNQLAALHLVFSRLAAAEAERRVAAMIAEAADMVAGLWVAYRGDKLVAAILAQRVALDAALLYVPRAMHSEPSDTARALATFVIAELTQSGVRIVEALLDPAAAGDANLLTELGFRHTTDLQFLVSTSQAFPDSRGDSPLEFLEYRPELHERLKDIVVRTYTGSLDCAEVDGLRRIDDILTGYRAIGVFAPERWLLVRHQDADVGCLLLADHPSSNQWELVYMGVVSEARGQGLGLVVTRHAQWLARQAGRSRVVLAVDARNTPAIAAYERAGFVTYEQHAMFLRTF